VTAGAVLLATRSLGKLSELHPLFERAGVLVVDLDAAGIVEQPEEDALEVFNTFEENALAKARYFQRLSGMPTVADDSGLEVHALGGKPGVQSKRWSGRPELSGRALDVANNATLQAALAQASDRRARYVCVAAFVDGDEEIVRRGEVAGRITSAARGSGGFGYDPYFEVEGLGVTFGECSPKVKEEYSHRGRAFRALLPVLALRR
jgi:XTP/dITP diphosphohydrolase